MSYAACSPWHKRNTRHYSLLFQPSKSTLWRWQSADDKYLSDENEFIGNQADDDHQAVQEEMLHFPPNHEAQPECHPPADHQVDSNSDRDVEENASSSASEAGSNDSSQQSDEESESSETADQFNMQVCCDGDGPASPTSSSSDVESDEPYQDSDSGDEEEFVPLYAGSEFSVDEAVLDVLTDYVKNNETKRSLKAHLKTFLKFIPSPNSMPKNVDQLLGHVERLVPNYSERAYSYCAGCLYYLKDENPCESCGGVERKQFYLCPIEEQIKNFFEKHNLAEVLDKYSQRQSSDGKIRDVLDGTEYRRVKVNDKYSLTLMMSTDGVSLAGSSKAKMWPVMFIICELPPHLRQKYLIVHGIWCDERDPPMNTYFKPIVDELKHVKTGVEWIDPETKEKHQSVVSVPLICADAPARAKLQNILGHNGIQGCNTCEQSTALLELTAEEEAARQQGKRVKRKRAYMYQEDPAILRTPDRMQEQAGQAPAAPLKNMNGVKGPTALSSIPGINMARSVYAEYMHSVCLGVVKQFLTLWLTVPGAWNISAHESDIDNFMKNIAPSSDIGRLPRGVSDLSNWKASELRSWLLFYSLPCLQNILPHEYFQHWILLVISMFLLLQEEISESDLNIAENLLKHFVKDVSALYRDRDNVYNVHMLLHLVQYVRWHGPLSCNSAFTFENYNGILKCLIHGTKNRGKELMKNVRIAHAVEVLRGKLIAFRHSGQIKKTELLNACTPQPCLSAADKALLATHGFDESAKLYCRARIGRDVYTSDQYTRERKRNNFTVKFKHGSSTAYGTIKFFVGTADSVFLMINKFAIDHTKTFCHAETRSRVTHILHVCNSNERVLVPSHNVVCKVIRVGDTICNIPNRFEKNL